MLAALAGSRTVQARTSLALHRMLRTLRPLRSATITINGAIQTFPPKLDHDEKALIGVILDPRAAH